MIDGLKTELNDKIKRALAHFEDELKKIHSGRAHAGMLDGVNAEVYGQTQPIGHLARILASDARTLSVTPYDPSTLAAIAKAIRDNQALGLNPVDDGKVIHVQIPDMTTERREQTIKLLGTKAEDCRVALRSGRHEVLSEAKKLQKDGAVSEDEVKRLESEVTRELETAGKHIDELVSSKTNALMTV